LTVFNASKRSFCGAGRMKSRVAIPAAIVVAVGVVAAIPAMRIRPQEAAVAASEAPSRPTPAATFADKVAARAEEEARRGTVYRETYQRLDYPGGDVPSEIGVCTDLVVRAYREAGVDLQRELHEDRAANPSAYPTELWEYKKADRNIDHRRCQNLVVYFERHATPVDARDPSRWRSGDVVFFARDGGAHPWHVGIVAGPGTLWHLYPPTASLARIKDLGPVHSVFRWPE